MDKNRATEFLRVVHRMYRAIGAHDACIGQLENCNNGERSMETIIAFIEYLDRNGFPTIDELTDAEDSTKEIKTEAKPLREGDQVSVEGMTFEFN